jgi:hypothetical protein
MKRYQLNIALLEDMHTGSGTGAGDYDALLARDRNGNPVIPASNWLGTWKHNLARSGLHKDDELNKLFGAESNQRSALTATALYWDSEQNKKIVEDSLAWTSISRKEHLRVAKENTLRTREFIPAGAAFKAEIWLRDDSLEDALKTACRITDCLGARRQRGDGRITANLVDMTASPSRTGSHCTSSYIRLLLCALDPICLPITGYPGNLIKSECYIRGQMLRGAMIGWLLRKGNTDAAKTLIENEKILFGNAYPLPVVKKEDDWQNWQILPMPLQMATKKPDGSNSEGLPWWAKDSSDVVWKNQFDDETKKFFEKLNEKPKRPSDCAFIFSENGKDWQSFNANLAQRLRNCPGTESLFAQEEIPEKTLFIAELQFPDVKTANDVLESLNAIIQQQDCLSIGRGGAPLAIAAMTASPLRTGSHNAEPESNKLTITLTSDLIARSPYLGFYDSLSPKVVCGLLGFPESEEWQSRYYGDYVEVYGFNPCIGLPRLPVLAIRRGASLQIKGEGVDKLREKLLAVPNFALGERTEEGFGRFRLDFEPKFEAKQNTPEEPKTSVTKKPNEEERIYQLALDAFKELPENKDSFPALGQWQALRFHKDEEKSLLKLIDAYKSVLKEKQQKNNNITWLKEFYPVGETDKKEWLEWLVAKLKHELNNDDEQRVFYRALLAKVRLKLRKKEGEQA